VSKTASIDPKEIERLRRRLNWLPSASGIGVFSGLTMVALAFSEGPYGGTPRDAFLLFTGSALVVGGLFGFRYADRLDKRVSALQASGPALTERASRLQQQFTDAMAALAGVSAEMEAEAERARQVVEKLREDVQTYEALAEVSQKQAEAVARLVQGEMQTEGRRSFRQSLWWGIAVNSAFFLMGVAFTLLTTSSN
jgi:hypothetical protein